MTGQLAKPQVISTTCKLQHTNMKLLAPGNQRTHTFVSHVGTGGAYSGSPGSANRDTNCAIPATNQLNIISIHEDSNSAHINQSQNNKITDLPIDQYPCLRRGGG